ncbi:MAG: Asp-tRNA(Asn)/Glu-tRNA(Gln) amidotransferase subunit GatC [Nitrospirales bacterium]|nr:Asp-tRNA(Asn)/Glu-tRNA(Gln) amidotransferase subunit GatC [Nitrospirales bacterium]
MGINQDHVRHVGQLARLHLSEEEIEAFSPQLNEILRYVDELNTIETDGVEPIASVVDQANVLREDALKPCLPHEQAVANGPEVIDGSFRVPNILENR